MKSLIRKTRHVLGLDHVKFNGINLPNFRTNQGLKDNESYLNSGHEQIQFLTTNNLVNDATKMLDFGCGQGRIANCLQLKNIQLKSYTGVDTDKSSIQWCNKYISSKQGAYRFFHVPAFNARYNKSATGLKEIPFESESFNLIFLNSVFSHMLEDDIRFYLKEFHRLLPPNGTVYLTAFIEENVPNVSENPEDYLEPSSGALHRVRFEHDHIMSIFKDSGFQVSEFIHQGIDRTRQSVVVLRRA